MFRDLLRVCWAIDCWIMICCCASMVGWWMACGMGIAMGTHKNTHSHPTTKTHTHNRPRTQTDTHECWTRQRFCRPTVLPPSGLVDSFEDACCCRCPSTPGLQQAPCGTAHRQSAEGQRRARATSGMAFRTRRYACVHAGMGTEAPTHVFQGLRDDSRCKRKRDNAGAL